jgi:NTE family protein
MGWRNVSMRTGEGSLNEFCRKGNRVRGEKLLGGCLAFLLVAVQTTGCAHYPANQPLKQVDLESGYRGKLMGAPGQSGELLLILTFSGGGTRAAAFSYGVLEELRNTRVTLGGKDRRLLDEVDAISAVSGGSFTAGYYGLFGDRIFEDFESRFLKKNIQDALTTRTLFNPVNWVRLSSPYFDRSDLAVEYYDKHVFDGGTFSDIAARRGPMILMNATDMVSGFRIAFNQDSFDLLCSDLSPFPVARAAAASSAVPMLLSPITLHNYAGSCGYRIPEGAKEILGEADASTRRYHYVEAGESYLDAERRPYIHLVDGGVSDNLGLRAALDRVLALGDFWSTVKFLGDENVRKVVFIVVNAETAVQETLSLSGKPPGFSAMSKSYSSIGISQYNYETVQLLRESFQPWSEEVRQNRCGSGTPSTDPGACGDIRFYLVEVKFEALQDEAERTHFKGLPTTFKLPPEEVEKLQEAARRILSQSEEFQRLLHDLQ